MWGCPSFNVVIWILFVLGNVLRHFFYPRPVSSRYPNLPNCLSHKKEETQTSCAFLWKAVTPFLRVNISTCPHSFETPDTEQLRFYLCCNTHQPDAKPGLFDFSDLPARIFIIMAKIQDYLNLCKSTPPSESQLSFFLYVQVMHFHTISCAAVNLFSW